MQLNRRVQFMKESCDHHYKEIKYENKQIYQKIKKYLTKTGYIEINKLTDLMLGL